MSTTEITPIKAKSDLNQAASDVADLTPRLEILSPTPAEIDALLDKIIPAPMLGKYTNTVQKFATQTEAEAELDDLRIYCTCTRKVYESVRKRKRRGVAKTAIFGHKCGWEMVKTACINRGIKVSDREDGEISCRGLARAAFGLEHSDDFSTAEKNLNAKDVGIHAGYLRACIKRLVDTPLHFQEDAEDKLVAMIASYGGLGNFVKGELPSVENPEEEENLATHAVKPPTPARAIATSTSPVSVPVTNVNNPAAPTVTSGPTGGSLTHDDEPEYWPLVPQHKIDGSEPDEPRIARARNLWQQKWLDQLKNRPNVQEIALTNPPTGLHETTTFVLASFKAGTVKLLAMSNLLLYQGDIIRLLADQSPALAPLLVKALSDMATTKVLPSFMMEHSAWDDHLTAVISRSQLSLTTADTFLLSTLNNKSRAVIRCKLNSPAIKGTSFPLALQADHFGGVTMWDSHGIGGAIASDTLAPSSNGGSSYELAVDWCFSSELLSFDPFPDGVWQADFDFGSFEPEYEATMNSRESTMLQFEVLAPWIEAFGKRKLAKRKNVQAVHLHLDNHLAIEFNESPAGGVEHSYAMQTRKKQARTLSLAFNYDDLLPVLCFLTHENASNVDVAANPDGIAFYVDLGYAHFSIYVPALTTDGSKTKDVLFTQFP